MSKTSPYFLFDGDCEEAMKFYHSCLGGDLTITKVGDSPMKDKFPPQLQNRVVNAKLVNKNGVEISASDWLLANRTRKQGNTTCAYISDATHEELQDYFDKLSKGGDAETQDNLQQTPFGTYGALTDKYGVRWMFQGNPK